MSSIPELSVSLELDDVTVRLIRELQCGDAPVIRTIAWTASYPDPSGAQDAYEALRPQESRLLYWSVGALAIGADWLTPIIAAQVTEYAEERDEAARKADDERKRAEHKLSAQTKVTLYYINRDDEFAVTLEYGDEEFWSASFEEKWERERFGDWLKWQDDRFAEFAEYMKGGDRFELERKLLREMLVTEQAVKKQGFGAGGRRPLRFWRGEA